MVLELRRTTVELGRAAMEVEYGLGKAHSLCSMGLHLFSAYIGHNPDLNPRKVLCPYLALGGACRCHRPLENPFLLGLALFVVVDRLVLHRRYIASVRLVVADWASWTVGFCLAFGSGEELLSLC